MTGASFEDGLLTVELVREIPEHKKPRKVEIGGTLAPANSNLIEGDRLAAELSGGRAAGLDPRP